MQKTSAILVLCFDVKIKLNCATKTQTAIKLPNKQLNCGFEVEFWTQISVELAFRTQQKRHKLSLSTTKRLFFFYVLFCFVCCCPKDLPIDWLFWTLHFCVLLFFDATNQLFWLNLHLTCKNKTIKQAYVLYVLFGRNEIQTLDVWQNTKRRVA